MTDNTRKIQYKINELPMDAVVVEFDMVMINGKELGDCTPGELRNMAKWLVAFADISK